MSNLEYFKPNIIAYIFCKIMKTLKHSILKYKYYKYPQNKISNNFNTENFDAENFDALKCYESTEVDRRTWLHMPSGTHWSTSSDTHQVVEI